jgi:hypothetical protein
MTAQPIEHSSAFVSFSHAALFLAPSMVAGGVFVMPIDDLLKGLPLMDVAKVQG